MRARLRARARARVRVRVRVRVRGEDRRRIVEVEADAAVVEGEQPREVEPLADAEDVAREALLAVAARELRFELVDLLHGNVTPLAHLG